MPHPLISVRNLTKGMHACVRPVTQDLTEADDVEQDRQDAQDCRCDDRVEIESNDPVRTGRAGSNAIVRDERQGQPPRMLRKQSLQ